MNCENYEHLINDLVEGELNDVTADEVSLHIFDCQNCTFHFEMLEREKAMYSHYLFEIEPPSNLLNKFQAKLETEKQPLISSAQNGLFSKVFAFLQLNPIFATAVALILLTFAFGLFSLINEEEPLNQAKNFQPSFPAIQMLPSQKGREEIFTPQNTEKSRDVAKNEERKIELISKPIVVKQNLEVKNAELKLKTPPKVVKQSEEELQLKKIQALELETAKQIEKVELLLRSFRNARLIDGSEIYDVSYEQQQARKLLQNNIALRQRAETYGTFFAEEMLSKVEPYLLDIANLDIDSAPEEVLEIKERVKSQNIIASLQGF